MGIYFPIAKSRFNLVKRNAVQESLRSNSFPGSLIFYETGRAETLWTRFRCVTTWFNVTRHSSSSVTKLLLIDTFGYMDRNSRTSSLDSREQKETSSSFKCLHCFNNLPKKKTKKKKQKQCSYFRLKTRHLIIPLICHMARIQFCVSDWFHRFWKANIIWNIFDKN